MSQKPIHDRVVSQFGAVAANYTASVGHANEKALTKVVTLAEPKSTDALLDIATGSGNTALAFAPHVHRVTALDLTPAMLEQVRVNAEKKGLGNVETCLAPAEEIPYEDGAFDIVTNRLAAHHFANLKQAVEETARVLKPGGKFLLVDTIVPDDAALSAEINEIELLRDPSHVKNLSVEEWTTMLEGCGFAVQHVETGVWAEGLRLEFEDWTRRIGTPAENIQVLRDKLSNPSDALKQELDIKNEDGEISFVLPEVTILAVKAR